MKVQAKKLSKKGEQEMGTSNKPNPAIRRLIQKAWDSVFDLRGGVLKKVFKGWNREVNVNKGLKKYNDWLRLLTSLITLSTIFGLIDYFNQRAIVEFSLNFEGSREIVWIEESEIGAYYKRHNQYMPAEIARILTGSPSSTFTHSKDLKLPKFKFYSEETSAPFLWHRVREQTWFRDRERLYGLEPNLTRGELEAIVEKMVRLENYSPYLRTWARDSYPKNQEVWRDSILPKMKVKLSEEEYNNLLLAFFSARRVENFLHLGNVGDLPAKNIKIYIKPMANLMSGSKGSVISTVGMLSGSKSEISDYPVAISLPILDPYSVELILVRTREAPLSDANILLDYESEKRINLKRIGSAFGVLVVISIFVIVTLGTKK